MTDVITTIVEPITAVTAPVEPAQAPIAPVAPVVTPTPEPAPAPSVEPLVGTEQPVVVPEPAPAPVTLISEGLDKPVAEVAPVVTEGGQSVEPAPPPPEVVIEPPKYDAFTAPEGITLDQDGVGKFTELLSSLELEGKANHDAVQQFGQKAVNFHIDAVNTALETQQKYFQTTWEKQKSDWKEATLKDPEIGGNRIQTTLDSVLGFIRTHGGTADQQKEFRNVMETSGLGNHPAVIRLFANAALAYSEGKPLAAVKPVQDSKSRTQTMYGK